MPQIYSREQAEHEIEAARKLGTAFVAVGEADYPHRLQMIDDAPPLITVCGHAGVLTLPQVAIVGSRNASAARAKITQRLVHGLCEARFAIVSGLARGIDAARAAYREFDVQAEVLPFIEDMAAAYGWADLVICRAGALTVSELAAVGVGSILVPFPHGHAGEQIANAEAIAEAGGAWLIPEQAFTPIPPPPRPAPPTRDGLGRRPGREAAPSGPT